MLLPGVYAKKQSVRTNEFYNATMNGLSPSCEFVVKRLNYNGQNELEWNNERYSIIRTIDPKNKFDIVLICARKIALEGVFSGVKCKVKSVKAGDIRWRIINEIDCFQK